MRDFTNLGVAAVAVVCIVALFLDIYPGVLADLLFIAILVSFVAVPIAGLGAIVVILVLFWNDKVLKCVRATWLQAVVWHVGFLRPTPDRVHCLATCIRCNAPAGPTV